MSRVPLNISNAVKLDINGAGTVKLGPLSARESWYPTNVHVGASTNTKEAICNIYIGDTPSPATFRDSTYSGSSGDMCDGLVDVVASGWYVYAVWTGGDAGATATLAVTGTKDV